jgi:hypothetical protein
MNYKLKTIRLSAVFIALLSTLQLTQASASMTKHPSRTEGTAFGFGLGAKFLNLKNISTKNSDTNGGGIRSHDGMANTSSPVISIFARKYIPDLLALPMFGGVEFNYLTQMKKKSIYANLNQLPGVGLDTGYRYEERWDARAMVGLQIWNASQLDFWAQAGLQLTSFDYQGIATDTVATGAQQFNMYNNYALAPVGGLEMRFSQPNMTWLFNDGTVVTDFILGWTAGYRNAFKILGVAPSGNKYEMAMSSNWSHTFGLKVMFRF